MAALRVTGNRALPTRILNSVGGIVPYFSIHRLARSGRRTEIPVRSVDIDEPVIVVAVAGSKAPSIMAITRSFTEKSDPAAGASDLAGFNSEDLIRPPGRPFPQIFNQQRFGNF